MNSRVTCAKCKDMMETGSGEAEYTNERWVHRTCPRDQRPCSVCDQMPSQCCCPEETPAPPLSIEGREEFEKWARSEGVGDYDLRRAPNGVYLNFLAQSRWESWQASRASDRERVKELEAWKASASDVMNRLDLQAIGKELGVQLGSDIAAQVLQGIRDTKARAESAQARVAELQREKEEWERVEKVSELEFNQLADQLSETQQELQKYLVAIADTHEVLDGAGVPKAARASCDDPKCKSHIGHRTRALASRLSELTGLLKRALPYIDHDPKCPEFRQEANRHNGGCVQDSAFPCRCGLAELEAAIRSHLKSSQGPS